MGIDFERPPVSEVAMGFEFTAPSGFGVRSLVHAHDEVSEGYSRFEEKPPLPPFLDGQPSLVLEQRQFPLPRLWAEDEDRGLLLQMQTDRLILNWRSGAGSRAYPRFPSLFSEYQERWARFLKVLARLELTPPIAGRVEFTYVNEVDEVDGLIWTEALAQPSDLPGSEGMVAFHLTRSIDDPGAVGSVRVNAQREVGARKSTMVITARLSANPESEPFAVLRRAHDLAAASFFALTTRTAHDHWGIRE